MKRLVALTAFAAATLAALPAMATTVKGTLAYEEAKANGTPVGYRPIRGVMVHIFDNDHELTSVPTDSLGRYTAIVNSSDLNKGDYLRIEFTSDNDVAAVKLDTDGFDDSLVWGNKLLIGDDKIKPMTLDWTVTVSQLSQHFSILDTLMIGHDFAEDREESSDSLDKFEVQYPDADHTSSQDNAFGDDNITVHGYAWGGYGHSLPDPDPDDGFDDKVILHEYGHILTFQISESDSPGGPHQLCTFIDDEFSWFEGFATYFAYAVRDSNPTFFNGNFGEIEEVGTCVDRSEDNVTRLLWDLHDGPGVATDGFDKVDGLQPQGVQLANFNLFGIFDSELDDFGGPTPNIFHFHDALVGRGLSSYKHADVDRVFLNNHVNPHALSDYSVDHASAPLSVHAGMTINVNATLSNNGTALYADELMTLRIAEHVKLNPVTLKDIPVSAFSGVGVPTNYSVTIPATWAPGIHEISVTADPLDRFPESNENNNQQIFTVRVL